jgi:hypothetical protein
MLVGGHYQMVPPHGNRRFVTLVLLVSQTGLHSKGRHYLRSLV